MAIVDLAFDAYAAAQMEAYPQWWANPRNYDAAALAFAAGKKAQRTNTHALQPDVPDGFVQLQTRDVLMILNYESAHTGYRLAERRIRALLAAGPTPEAQPQREASEAGQGVDLEAFRRPVTVWRALAEIGVCADYMPYSFRKKPEEYTERVKEADRLLAIIDAATHRMAKEQS